MSPHETIHMAAVQGTDIALAAVIFGSLSTLFYPLIRAVARRMEGGSTPAQLPTRGIEERLDRIERAVESIALEVERVSEGQRFVTKLMAERPSTKLPSSTE